MFTTQEIGAHGEDTAARYLARSGYQVRERNVRFKRDEIDIVAFDRAEKMIVFAEVKTRSSHSERYPIHTAVDLRKRRAMRRAVAAWVLAHQFEGSGRIDILSVCEGRIVEHLKDIGSDFF